MPPLYRQHCVIKVREGEDEVLRERQDFKETQRVVEGRTPFMFNWIHSCTWEMGEEEIGVS